MLDPRQEARKLLKDLGYQDRKPVPVEDIAKQLGAKIVLSEPEDEICGMIFKDGDNIIIGVNSLHPPTRQRFTIAHEIGHFVMHGDLIKKIHVDKTFNEKLYRDGRSKLGEVQMEIEANRFAAELLMPSSMLEADAKNAYMDPDKGAEELAKQYNVSSQAMSIKLMELFGADY